jgi:hypothetical protein|tara:strand:+ start:232 stop:738 length:507 start_codon:yes stop_codon:yes gene_type:complete
MRRRDRGAKRAVLTGSEREGLLSFIAGNEKQIGRMLDLPRGAVPSREELLVKLQEVMGVSTLSTEALLARFFESTVLSAYAKRAELSGNGSTSVLAARIAKVWRKGGFEMPVEACAGKKRKGGEAAASSADALSASPKKEESSDEEEWLDPTAVKKARPSEGLARPAA